MVKRTGASNVYLRSMVASLERSESNFWKAIGEKLGKASRKQIEVNLGDIERHTEKDDVVVVPGVVLASGDLSKPVTVAAWRFSGAAGEKIKNAKGKTMGIDELMKEKPKGDGVKIIA